MGFEDIQRGPLSHKIPTTTCGSSVMNFPSKGTSEVSNSQSQGAVCIESCPGAIQRLFSKEKTGFDITYGDWSSDVCSSDLGDIGGAVGDLVVTPLKVAVLHVERDGDRKGVGKGRSVELVGRRVIKKKTN